MPSSKKATRFRRKYGLWRWHRWIGLSCLIFLLAAALSGSILVYKKALIKWLMAPSAQLPAGYSIAEMESQLHTILRSYPGEARDLIKAPNPEEPYWTLQGIDGSVQLLAMETLKPITENKWVLECLSFLRELHVTLLAGFSGKVILLVSGIAGIVLCVTGIVLWWPARKGFRWRWIFPLPVKKNFLLHYHRHSGILIGLISLMVLITGSLMQWQKTVRPILPPVETSILDHSMQNLPSEYARLLPVAHTYLPDGWPTYIRLPSAKGREASIRFRLPGEWHPNGRTSVTFETDPGNISITTRSDKVSPARKLINQLYPLHSAYGLNNFYAFVVFSSGIGIIWLGITGGANYFK